MSSMTAFLILSLPANTLSSDITMHAVQFWRQESSYLSDQRVSYLWLKERGRERGILVSALGWNMDAQGIIPLALRQTDGAAYSTFHFYLFLPVRPTNLYLFFCITPVIFSFWSVYLLLYNIGISYKDLNTVCKPCPQNKLFHK